MKDNTQNLKLTCNKAVFNVFIARKMKGNEKVFREKMIFKL